MATLPTTIASTWKIHLKPEAEGGRAPLTWLLSGALVGSFDRFKPVLYTLTGKGIAHITVVDSQGRSDSSEVRFKRHS